MYYYNLSDQSYPIHTACLTGDIDGAERLLKSDNLLCNQRNENGMTPILVVVSASEGTILEDLLNVLIFFGADPNSRSPVTGDTPLQSVISYGRYESAERAAPILLRAGADPHAVNKVGQSAIDAAIVHNYRELAELLSNYKMDASVIDDWEEKRGQRPNKTTPKKPFTPSQPPAQPLNNMLLNAVIRGDKKLVEETLNQGASINYKNEEGFSALHYAVSRCASDRLGMTQLLVNNMADVNASSEIQQSNKTRMWNIKGSSFTRRYYSYRFNRENDSPLSLAIKKNHSEPEVYDIVKCLLDNGANKHISDLDEKTPLVLATERNLHRVVDLLSDQRPPSPKPPTPPPPAPPAPSSSDPNDFEGPFHRVHELCMDETLTDEERQEELDKEFDRGVYINIRTKVDHDTCLIIACQRQDEELVKYLLNRDATVDVSNMKKESPISVTQNLKNKRIEPLLLEAQKRQKAKLRWRTAGAVTAATQSKSCMLL